MWRVKYDKLITPIKFDGVDWLIGVQLQYGAKRLIILCHTCQVLRICRKSYGFSYILQSHGRRTNILRIRQVFYF